MINWLLQQQKRYLCLLDLSTAQRQKEKDQLPKLNIQESTPSIHNNLRFDLKKKRYPHVLKKNLNFSRSFKNYIWKRSKYTLSIKVHSTISSPKLLTTMTQWDETMKFAKGNNNSKLHCKCRGEFRFCKPEQSRGRRREEKKRATGRQRVLRLEGRGCYIERLVFVWKGRE